MSSRRGAVGSETYAPRWITKMKTRKIRVNTMEVGKFVS